MSRRLALAPSRAEFALFDLIGRLGSRFVLVAPDCSTLVYSSSQSRRSTRISPTPSTFPSILISIQN